MLVQGILLGVLCIFTIWLIFTIRILKRKIQELAMQVSLLNQENERIRKRLDKISE